MKFTLDEIRQSIASMRQLHEDRQGQLCEARCRLSLPMAERLLEEIDRRGEGLPKDQAERDDAMFNRGRRAVWLRLLEISLYELGYLSDAWSLSPGGRTVERLIEEREEIIVALRQLCEDHGDNDWTEQDHLPGVIEKHLGRYLEADE